MKFSYTWRLMLLWLSLCVSCSTKSEHSPSDGLEKSQTFIQLDEKSAVILVSEYNERLDSVYGYHLWVPDSGELATVDSILDVAIQREEFSFIKEPVKENIRRYFYRQYIPYFDERGNRIMWINALCDISGSSSSSLLDWRNEYINVSDGGSCYWQIRIDIDDIEYVNYGPNASR